MSTEPLTITRPAGLQLAARLERPAGAVRGFAVFAHCFTCGKDSAAAVRISRGLARRGIATLRFDVTGIGASGGDFAASTFSSSVDDLVAAAEALGAAGSTPALLIGHSLGGAAVIAAAARLPSVTGVVTIGAPADVGHVLHQFGDAAETIERVGEADVTFGKKTFRMQRAFLHDTREHPQLERIANLRRALLVLHAPLDNIVGIENATQIFVTARHPKSFVSLDRADHFVSEPAAADYAASVIAGWAERYLPPMPPADEPAGPPPGTVRVGETKAGHLQNLIMSGSHRFFADEPAAVGGGGTGPNPYDLLCASLGACTSMTLRLYADRKGLAVDRISVDVRHDKIYADDCAECETREGRIDQLTVTLQLEGPLTHEQRTRMVEIAAKCPVHRTLHSEIRTTVALAAAAKA
ncbi:MAG: bifunctional alpha/beta hydrolase/OsmC family protein [Beijerinckiaceae bacterium]|nr:bifunctional alpha/beta hydrolase/OsmC family protein [Beijerinckiaceae bacterium]